MKTVLVILVGLGSVPVNGVYLIDGAWAIIAPLLPNNSCGIERFDDCWVINGIVWRFRTCSSWRDVPERYGPRDFPDGAKSGIDFWRPFQGVTVETS